MTGENKQTKKPSGRHPVIGSIVLLSMGIAAAAFAAGLYVHGGIGVISSVIAGLAMMFVMAASHTVFMGSLAQAETNKRIANLEATFSRLANDVERINQAGEASEQLDELSQRAHGLKRMIDQAEKLGTVVNAAAQMKRLAGETERLDARLEAFRNQATIETQERHNTLSSDVKERHEALTADLTKRHEALAADFKMLETLVKQVAEKLAADEQNRRRMNEFLAAAGAVEAVVGKAGNAGEGAGQAVAAPAVRTSTAAAEEPVLPALDPAEVEALLLEEVRRSVDAGKIELYLQPIMIIPQRRIRYYEALTRLKSDAGRLILPKDYLSMAEQEGMMPVIDNVMLFRSVQVLRRLEKRSSARGVFCNISVYSLLDPEFFAEFIAFMEQNRELAEAMVFEFGQSVIDNCGPVELESLSALAALGFRFSLDQVTNLDVDFQRLHEMGFRHVKIEADLFLNRMEEAGARIHPTDMKSYLERFGMQLIIEKIEDERALANVLDHQVRLGQGYLFSEPRPVRPEVFGDNQDAEAA